MFVLEKELKEKVEEHLGKFSRVLKSCLKVKDEEILIISDYGIGENKLAPMLAYGYCQAAQEKGKKVNLIFQGVKKGFMQADEQVIRALRQLEKNSVIILSLSNKLGRLGVLGSNFRVFCRKRGCRFASSSSLGGTSTGKLGFFMEAMDVNYPRIARQGEKLKKIFDRANQIRVKTEKGTDITFSVEGKKALVNAGDYREAGKGGNLPAGEVYIPPQGINGVEGIVIVDGSLRGEEGTILLKEPVKLVIKEGRIAGIEGTEKDWLEKALAKGEARAKYPERVCLVGELGFGINPKAVLVGSAILDEKVLGTAHIGIGSNDWFGGDIRTVLHLDQVFLNPQIYADGEKIEI